MSANPFVGVDEDGPHFIDANTWFHDQATATATAHQVVDSCRDPSTRINWDGVHLTEAANKWIFHQIVHGFYSDPPLSLNFSCNKFT